MVTEVFKSIKGYEGLYEISNYGRVKRLGGIVLCKDGKPKSVKEKILIGCNSGCGYRKVCLSKNGKINGKNVHTLVYETFIGSIPKGMEINHIDEDKINNAVWNLELVSHKDNLEWGTRGKRQSETIKEKYKTDMVFREGLIDRISKNWGKNKRKVKQYTKDGEFVKEWDSIKEAAIELGLKTPNIIACCKNKQKTCGGYEWKY